MCCKQCSKRTTREILEDEEKTAQTIAELVQTAKNLGLKVEAIPQKDEDDEDDEFDERRLSPDEHIGNINRISKLKGLYDQ